MTVTVGKHWLVVLAVLAVVVLAVLLAVLAVLLAVLAVLLAVLAVLAQQAVPVSRRSSSIGHRSPGRPVSCGNRWGCRPAYGAPGWQCTTGLTTPCLCAARCRQW